MIDINLSEYHFEIIRKIVFSISGIDLQEGKEELVKSRLSRRLRALELNSFDEYIRLLRQKDSAEEINIMVDCLTTNKTFFFREFPHFEYMKKHILSSLKKHKCRIWSAGCSSGEEPYSIAVFLREELPDIDLLDIKILATDISGRMINFAREGNYSLETIKELSPHMIAKYFSQATKNISNRYSVNQCIRKIISFAKLNLMEEWPMRGQFDIIFCRNVMIYFNKKTQEQLVNRFWNLISKGGYLFVGHSESLTGLVHNFKYVQPAIYYKE